MNRFEAYEDIDGKWRWRMVGANGETMASSNQSFYSHASALRAADRVRLGAANSYVTTKRGLGPREALRLKALLTMGTNSRPARPRLGVRRATPDSSAVPAPAALRQLAGAVGARVRRPERPRLPLKAQRGPERCACRS